MFSFALCFKCVFIDMCWSFYLTLYIYNNYMWYRKGHCLMFLDLCFVYDFPHFCQWLKIQKKKKYNKKSQKHYKKRLSHLFPLNISQKSSQILQWRKKETFCIIIRVANLPTKKKVIKNDNSHRSFRLDNSYLFTCRWLSSVLAKEGKSKLMKKKHKPGKILTHRWNVNFCNDPCLEII